MEFQQLMVPECRRKEEGIVKTRSLKTVSKKLVAGFLAVTMITTGVVIIPKTARAATEVCFATADEYKMSEYWSTTEKKVPVKDGYVFSGWYKDETTPLKQADLTEADVTAIAKFVPAEVLSIKTQAALGTDTSSLRILSSVDSLNYQEVGFKYKLAILPETQTENITNEHYQLIEKCWCQQPNERLKIEDIISILETEIVKINQPKKFI